jgi:hypothetical protein
MSPAAHAATATVRRSARFVSWVRAWRAGLVPYDEVAGEITGDEEHLAADLPGTWTDVSLGEAIAALSKLHPDEIRLVLPVPGDPRGLPGPGPFTGAALITGEGVVAGTLGLVPEVRTHTSGSGDTFETVLWRIFALPEQTAQRYHDEPSPAEAEAELSAALIAATTALTKLDVAQWRPELAGALAALRRPDNSTDLPPGYDARARRLYARASVLDRVLALAELSAPGGAINGYEAQQREDALRPLTRACRRALVAACNAPMI